MSKLNVYVNVMYHLKIIYIIKNSIQPFNQICHANNIICNEKGCTKLEKCPDKVLYFSDISIPP